MEKWEVGSLAVPRPCLGRGGPGRREFEKFREAVDALGIKIIEPQEVQPKRILRAGKDRVKNLVQPNQGVGRDEKIAFVHIGQKGIYYIHGGSRV